MRLLAATTIVVALAAAALLGGALREGGATAAPSTEAQRAATRGLVLQQQARVSGNPALYPRAEQALERALRLDPRNASAIRGLSALAASRHRFRESLDLARRAQALEPGVAVVYGLIGDANLELGRYPDAFAAFDRMAALRPSANVYARISYARELTGDLAGRARGDGARNRLRRRRRAVGVDAHAHREPAALPAPAGRGEGALPGGAGVRAGLRRRSERAGRHPGGERRPRGRSRPLRPRGGRGAGARVRSEPRRHPRPARPSGRGGARLEARRRARAALRRERRPQPARNGRVRPEPRPQLPVGARPRAARAGRAAERRGRPRARLGALQERPLRRGAHRLAPLLPAGDAGRRRPLPPQPDRALPRKRLPRRTGIWPESRRSIRAYLDAPPSPRRLQS